MRKNILAILMLATGFIAGKCVKSPKKSKQRINTLPIGFGIPQEWSHFAETHPVDFDTLNWPLSIV
jgi:hypothetical protein